ncbi:B12-binding domain-containing protein [Chloroflexota bacterium]
MKGRYKQNKLILAIAGLKEDLAIDVVRQRLIAKDDPMSIIADCQEGIRQVGERYSKRKYFLSGLIMGGEIFSGVMESLLPVMKSQISGNDSGKVLLGTVASDIHDLGKNIVRLLLGCHKFTVYDLGVDVPPEEFLSKANEIKPDVIGLSGLITNAYDSMRDTIVLLRNRGCHVPVIIGGSQLDEEVFRYTGADYWVKDATSGVELCQRLLSCVK